MYQLVYSLEERIELKMLMKEIIICDDDKYVIIWI